MTPQHWLSLAFSIFSAAITVAVVWGYNKKTLEVVEKSSEKHSTTLESLHKAFTEFREEVRVRLAVNDTLTNMAQHTRGGPRVQDPSRAPARAAARKRRSAGRTHA